LNKSIPIFKKNFPEDDLCICNFNSGKEPLILPEIAKSHEVNYKTFALPEIKKNRLVCHEILAMLKISQHYYNKGYDFVYLLHGDIQLIGDYKESFKGKSEKDFSAIVPFIDFTTPRSKDELREIWESTKHFKSTYIEKFSKARLTQSCLLFSKRFIEHINNKFGDIENFFDKNLKNSSPYGDCSLFDLNFGKFKVQPLLDPISIESKWVESFSGEFLKFKIPNVQYIHNGL